MSLVLWIILGCNAIGIVSLLLAVRSLSVDLRTVNRNVLETHKRIKQAHREIVWKLPGANEESDVENGG